MGPRMLWCSKGMQEPSEKLVGVLPPGTNKAGGDKLIHLKDQGQAQKPLAKEATPGWYANRYEWTHCRNSKQVATGTNRVFNGAPRQCQRKNSEPLAPIPPSAKRGYRQCMTEEGSPRGLDWLYLPKKLALEFTLQPLTKGPFSSKRLKTEHAVCVPPLSQ